MLPNVDQGMGIFLAGIGIGILLILAGRAGFRRLSIFGMDFQRPRDKTAQEIEHERQDQLAARDVERRQLAVAFQRYSEAAVGMVPMVEAPGPADRSLTNWFDVTAAAAAASLTKNPGDHFRVAIWADLGEPGQFTLLGSANHNRNDPSISRLSMADTIAGHAFRLKSGEYLCADIRKDRRYKARSKGVKPYQSVFAVRIGEAVHPWGVLTVDAPYLRGFGEIELVICRRFARLVSAGAAIAVARWTGVGTRELVPRARGPARIVAPMDPTSEESEEGTR